RQGLIAGAQSVIAGDGKIAAVEARRVEGRYNVLERAVFSPCEVCSDRPVPLWRIRADRIVHDQVERRIHYQNAFLDVFGVPIAFVPYFRHPSPEVRRASGFLPIDGGRDRAFGAFLKAPYYIVIDEHSDATLTPFIATDDGFILETEYRRRFENGFIDLDLNFGLTDYDADGDGFEARFGGFGIGRWTLDQGLYAGFDLAITADDPFLRRYDYTNRDRLFSEAFVRSYDGSNFATGSVAYLQSVRDGEPQGGIPIALPELSLRRTFQPGGLGGELGLTFDSSSLVRTDGRDVARASFGADWSRQAVTTGGVILRGFADARADLYGIDDDPAFDGEAARFSPRIGAEARMPFIRVEEGGVAQIVEPVIQFAYAADVFDGDIPNEDSVAVEFDEMNLFETDRFTGFDRRESGAYVTLGANYERIDPNGLSFKATGGRVIRFDDTDDFTPDSGLDGNVSDYVAGASIDYRDWLSLDMRGRFGDALGINRAEIGGALDFAPLTLSGYYLFVDDDPAEGSFDDRSEVTLAASLALDRNWTVGGDARRDLIEDRFVTAGGVLSYEDECAAIEAYVRRRFTESDDAPRGTSFGVRVRLFGAGSGDESRRSGACAYGAN
ncbi:MAG: LPS assembly protein LptD, partial [Pseudomonadota bacterium]